MGERRRGSDPRLRRPGSGPSTPEQEVSMNEQRVDRQVTPAGEGRVVQIGGFGTIYKIHGSGLPGSAAVVEHTLARGALAAPLHRHTHEDEITCVLEGEVTIQQGDEVTTAGAGSYVLKPRGVFHTFWNSGAGTARLIEIIAPSGFERYFTELQRLIPADGPPDLGEVLALAARYGLEFDVGSLPGIMERHGVRLV
jgi:quercetin dioxygenase-like cupin family protein